MAGAVPVRAIMQGAGRGPLPQRRSAEAARSGIPPVSDMSGRFSGVNAGYVAELYERYRQDPQSVDAATRLVFERGDPTAGAEATGAPARAGAAGLDQAA